MSQWNKNTVQDTLGLKKQVSKDLKENVIQMNEIDKDIFYDLVDQYEAMSENLEKGLKEYAPFEHLSEDIFQSLYKYKPRLNDEEDMKAYCQLNHSIMQEIMESDVYKDLRRATKSDMLSSAIGTEVIQNQAMEKIQYFKKQYEESKQTGQQLDGAAAGELINQINNAQGIQDEIDELLDKVGGDANKLSPKDAQKLAELQHKLNQIHEEIEANLEGRDQIQKAMDESIQMAYQTVEEVRDVVEAWGLEAGIHNRRISYDKRKKAIERVRRSPRLRELTDLIGRMKKIAMQKKKIKLPQGSTVEDIETGNKIESVIPSELMKLSHPTTKKDFMMRFHEKKLLQYKKSDDKQVGRGPVIVVHDKSGSMYGIKDDWSTALSLAMLEIAQKEKRNYAYIPYESRVIGNMVKNIKAGELDPDDIMDIAELSASGGTNFMAPLDEALRCIQSDAYKKGDICFITDGDCGISDDWLKEFLKAKEEHQFYVSTILINIGGGTSRFTVEKFSDNITTISNVAELDEANAAKIFNLIEDKEKFNKPQQ